MCVYVIYVFVFVSCIMFQLCVCIYVHVWAVHIYVCMHVHRYVFYTYTSQIMHNNQTETFTWIITQKCFLTGGVVLLIMCKPFMFIATSTDRSAVPKNLETKELFLSICPLNKTDLEITSEISAHIHSYINYSDI